MTLRNRIEHLLRLNTNVRSKRGLNSAELTDHILTFVRAHDREMIEALKKNVSRDHDGQILYSAAGWIAALDAVLRELDGN